MCGIVGIISGERGYNVNVRKFFTQALSVDTLRGAHSTGITAYARDKHNEHVMFKKAIPGYDFADLKLYDSFAKDIERYKYVIGHNRHATRGAVNSVNAHPFQHGDITLVHNGSLSSHRDLTKEFYTVDSEAICAAFSQNDPRDIIPRLKGAFALVWTDTSTGLLHMVRNEERPLAFLKLKDKDTILFASEKHMLIWLAERNHLAIDKVYDLKPGHLLTFGRDEKNATNWDTEEVELYVPPVNNRYTSRNTVVNLPVNKNTNSRRQTRRRERADNLTAALGQYGLKPHDEVAFEIMSKIPFDSNYMKTHGRVHATGIVVEKGLDLETIVYSIPDVSVELGDTIIGKIIGMEKSGNERLIINNDSLVILDAEGIKDIEQPGARFLSGPYNSKISFNEFTELTAKGCFACGEDIKMSDEPYMDWSIDGKPLCPLCAGVTTH